MCSQDNNIILFHNTNSDAYSRILAPCTHNGIDRPITCLLSRFISPFLCVQKYEKYIIRYILMYINLPDKLCLLHYCTGWKNRVSTDYTLYTRDHSSHMYSLLDARDSCWHCKPKISEIAFVLNTFSRHRNFLTYFHSLVYTHT